LYFTGAILPVRLADIGQRQKNVPKVFDFRKNNVYLSKAFFAINTFDFLIFKQVFNLNFMELDLAVIVMFGGNFAMSGYAFCDGQILPISQNTALFSILGTTYGGNGQNTFALPDLRGRVPIHTGGGSGPGLSPYLLGQAGGAENVTLTVGQMPGHNHTVVVNNTPGNAVASNGAFLSGGAPTGSGPNASLLRMYTTASSSQLTLNPASSGITGSNQAHSNIQPYLAVNFVIALQGIFPSRN
jgi:microcystin-dependent protein